MKCPKCGFNSFEYYDSCKKCLSDLTGYKQTYSIASVVLPHEAKGKMAAGFRSDESVSGRINESTEAHADMFSFDVPDYSAPSQRNEDPLHFDAPAGDSKHTSDFSPEGDIFADLLESTSQAKASPFAEKSPRPFASAEGAASNVSSVPGEFDLNSFSWNDTPVKAAAADNKEGINDFDALFSDTKGNSSK